MIWENTYFWNGHKRRCDDINPRRFDWWCDECKMAIQNKHVEDEWSPECPKCGSELADMDEYISQYNECSGVAPGDLTQDSEGNWVCD